jgi:hypothetical protein
MGGKGSAPSNNQAVQFEMQQAEEARQKEALRKSRLEAGTKKINEIFGGKKLYAPKQAALDWSGLTGDPSVAGASSGELGDTGLKWQRTGAEADPRWATATPQQRAWGLQNMGASGFNLLDPAGNPLASGASWADLMNATQGQQYTVNAPTGEMDPSMPGFDEAFYKKFYDTSFNFADKQRQDQYDRMRKNITYDLARAGTLRSSAANEAAADLERQNLITGGTLKAQAEGETGQLRSSIASQQQQLTNQLYATEDPTIAENAAMGFVKNANLQVPTQQTLGDLFKPLVIGALGAASAFNTQSGFNEGSGSLRGRNQSSGQNTPS